MKFIHISDLHIGKRVNEFSMIEDQIYILRQMLEKIEKEQPDGVLIAGDIYDKSVPSAEAVQVFDDFLVALAKQNLQVFIISGNHDSIERISFASRLMEASGVYIAPIYEGVVEPIILEDNFGKMAVYLLPFLKPAQVRAKFSDVEIGSYSEAVSVVINAMEVDTSIRNVIVTHQFVTGATCCDSEELSVGGTDQVDVTIFDEFDYVALGHIHGPQTVGRETVRYSGTPLKYSFSEVKHKKSMTVVELLEKGNVEIRTISLTPLRDLQELKGSYMELTSRDYYENLDCNQYVHITLTDEEDILDVIGKLRAIYPNIMKLDYDNMRTRNSRVVETVRDLEKKSPMELFQEFYEIQNNQPVSQEQVDFVQALMEDIWEGKS